jgi:hypothetical protein
MVDNEIPLWANLDLKQHTTAINSEMKINELKLPLLYNSQHPKFISKPHLYSIYYDSYRCILYGLYHPGVMLLGQLIEATVNEIIFVHDNKTNQGTFTFAIKYAEDTTGKIRKDYKKSLFPKFFIDFLKGVLEIRDCYTHLNYQKLFKDGKIKIYGFNPGDTFEENCQRLKEVVTKLSSGELQYHEVNPAFDKSVAEITKRRNDPEWAREWAWEIYPAFEFLIDEYLSDEDYQEHIRLYGSTFEAIPISDIES